MFYVSRKNVCVLSGEGSGQIVGFYVISVKVIQSSQIWYVTRYDHPCCGGSFNISFLEQIQIEHIE